MTLINISKALKKSNVKMLSNLTFPTLDNDKIIYFQALIEKSLGTSYSFKPDVYNGYYVVNNKVNKDYIELFGNEVGFHNEIINLYPEIENLNERNERILDHITKQNYYHHKGYEFVIVGIYKNKAIGSLLISKSKHKQPFISNTLTLNHGNSIEEIVNEIIVKKLYSTNGRHIINNIHIDNLMTFNNAPTTHMLSSFSSCSIQTIDKASKELLWFSLFYELMLQDDNEIQLSKIVERNDFVDRVYNRANTAIFDYNKYTPIMVKLFNSIFPFSVVNTVKKRDIIATLNKNDIIKLFNSIKPNVRNLSYAPIFHNNSYNISLKPNTYDAEKLISSWVMSVKGECEIGINEGNFVETICAMDMRNRTQMFDHFKNGKEILSLNYPTLVARSVFMENYYDGNFTTDKKKRSLIGVLNVLGVEYVRNEMKLSDFLLLHYMFSLKAFFPGKLNTDQLEKMIKSYLTYKQENNISNDVLFNFLFEFCESFEKIPNAYKLLSENNLLEKYNKGISPKMAFNIIGIKYEEKANNKMLNNYPYQYRELGY